MDVDTSFKPLSLKWKLKMLHHSLLSSINHLSSSLLWQQSGSFFEAKQLTRLCHRNGCWVPQFLWKWAKFLMRFSLLSPTLPQPSHGDAGWLSLLASRPAVWDVLPVLQSAGKVWQAYLPWCSLTWKSGEKKSWRALQLLQMPSCRTETHTWKMFISRII